MSKKNDKEKSPRKRSKSIKFFGLIFTIFGLMYFAAQYQRILRELLLMDDEDTFYDI